MDVEDTQSPDYDTISNILDKFSSLDNAPTEVVEDTLHSQSSPPENFEYSIHDEHEWWTIELSQRNTSKSVGEIRIYPDGTINAEVTTEARPITIRNNSSVAKKVTQVLDYAR